MPDGITPHALVTLCIILVMLSRLEPLKAQRMRGLKRQCQSCNRADSESTLGSNAPKAAAHAHVGQGKDSNLHAPAMDQQQGIPNACIINGVLLSRYVFWVHSLDRDCTRADRCCSTQRGLQASRPLRPALQQVPQLPRHLCQGLRHLHSNKGTKPFSRQMNCGTQPCDRLFPGFRVLAHVNSG
jgi:hypothetical protein